MVTFAVSTTGNGLCSYDLLGVPAAASSHLINLNIERDQSSMFYKTAQVESNRSPRYFLGGKDGEYRPLGDTCCVLHGDACCLLLLLLLLLVLSSSSLLLLLLLLYILYIIKFGFVKVMFYHDENLTMNFNF